MIRRFSLRGDISTFIEKNGISKANSRAVAKFFRLKNDVLTLTLSLMKILIATCILYQIVLMVFCCCFLTYRQRMRMLKLRLGDNLRYLCMLVETVYTFKNNPQLLRDRLLKEMTIKKWLCYHIVEENNNPLPVDLKCASKDKLLYKLHLEGFTPRELCVLFELNYLNTVYVKCHRMNKKLRQDPSQPSADTDPAATERRRTPLPDR